MDDFLSEVSNRLQRENAELGQSIEPENKQLNLKAFECMAGCFRRPDSMVACEECANQCQVPVKQAQGELSNRIQYVQTAFQTCLQGCGFLSGKADSAELRNCISTCADKSLEEFHKAKEDIQGIIRKYI